MILEEDHERVIKTIEHLISGDAESLLNKMVLALGACGYKINRDEPDFWQCQWYDPRYEEHRTGGVCSSYEDAVAWFAKNLDYLLASTEVWHVYCYPGGIPEYKRDVVWNNHPETTHYTSIRPGYFNL